MVRAGAPRHNRTRHTRGYGPGPGAADVILTTTVPGRALRLRRPAGRVRTGQRRKVGRPAGGDRGRARSAERVAAKRVLADLTLGEIVDRPLVDPAHDEVSRLILDTHDRQAFAPIAGMTVGEFREYLLDDDVGGDEIRGLHRAITPEIAAAGRQAPEQQGPGPGREQGPGRHALSQHDGGPGRAGRPHPANHPSDDLAGILLSAVDGLLFGCGDAVIGVNPVDASVESTAAILRTLDRLIDALRIPTQACCLGHLGTQLAAMEQGAPVDLLFQSVAGTEAANASFGINLSALREGRARVLEPSQDARRRLPRRTGDVLRDGAGECPVGRGAPRRRPTDARGPRVRRGARLRPLPGQQRGRVHRPGNTSATSGR